MLIAKIETFPLRIPFRSSAGTAASAWVDEGQSAADSLLVRVTTDDGLEGWGEAFGFRAVLSANSLWCKSVLKGHGFSRADRADGIRRASAPAGRFPKPSDFHHRLLSSRSTN